LAFLLPQQLQPASWFGMESNKKYQTLNITTSSFTTSSRFALKPCGVRQSDHNDDVSDYTPRVQGDLTSKSRDAEQKDVSEPGLPFPFLTRTRLFSCPENLSQINKSL
jgi:hypothetical protein